MPLLFTRWVCELAAQHDASQALSPLQVSSGNVCGLSEILASAKVPARLLHAFENEISALGAVDVRELARDDWAMLPSWALLREMEKRRVLAALQ